MQGFNVIDDYSHIPTAASSQALSPVPSPTSWEGSLMRNWGTERSSVPQFRHSSLVRKLEAVCQVKMIKPCACQAQHFLNGLIPC